MAVCQLISATKKLVYEFLLQPKILTLLKYNVFISDDKLYIKTPEYRLENLHYIDVLMISSSSLLLNTIPESIQPAAIYTSVEVEIEISHQKQISAPLQLLYQMVILIVEYSMVFTLALKPNTENMLSFVTVLTIQDFETDSVFTNILFCFYC
ncbi:Hypothetical_protein [Hexamita inflata]|uniref:Hypothetical_protein n=1 Tax=Hexamita inflata TaxID=28002 RepID=A0AA86NDU5_9EUKA|nr:Hypothetical protein HINF_LOCUS5350 [Hexamita inflata]